MKYQKSKELVKKVIEQEKKKTGIEIEALPFTTIENFSYILRKELFQVMKRSFQEKKEFITINFNSKVGAYYEDRTNTLKILLSNIRRNKELSPNSLYYLINLLVITYHEFNHKHYYEYRKKETQITLPYFIYLLEEGSHDQFHLYEKYREEFYIEIIAELYSYQKTNDILKKYPNLYKEIEPYLKIFILYFEVMYTNYDVERFVNKIYKQEPTIVIFLDKKPINRNLILDEDWSFEEIETKYTIISSQSFLDRLEYKNLETKELEILLSSLIYSLKKEETRNQENKKLELKKEELQKKFPKYFNQINTVENLHLKKQRRNKSKIKYLEIQIYEIQKELENRKKSTKTRRKIK